jgi:hypothetical protein
MISVTCKWASVIIGIGICLGLLSLAGNVHVAEFFGSLIIGLGCGAGFYLTVCPKKNKNT